MERSLGFKVWFREVWGFGFKSRELTMMSLVCSSPMQRPFPRLPTVGFWRIAGFSADCAPGWFGLWIPQCWGLAGIVPRGLYL